MEKYFVLFEYYSNISLNDYFDSYYDDDSFFENISFNESDKIDLPDAQLVLQFFYLSPDDVIFDTKEAADAFGKKYSGTWALKENETIQEIISGWEYPFCSDSINVQFKVITVFVNE